MTEEQTAELISTIKKLQPDLDPREKLDTIIHILEKLDGSIREQTELMRQLLEKLN